MKIASIEEMLKFSWGNIAYFEKEKLNRLSSTKILGKTSHSNN